MAFQSNEFWLVAMIGLIGVVGGFGLFTRWCAFSPAVRRAQLEKLCLGMTSAEVVALIGQPRSVKQMPDGRHWAYGSRMKRHVLMMKFSEEDKLQSFAHGVPGEGRHTPFPYDSRHEP